jgi:hypothetical protein
MGKKKLQVFVSSTYNDLKDERQAAVEAILDSGHIPAGMELFKSGNESQLETIKKWINESDIYMLILGGRYGSIEPLSKEAYTHIEYKYAVEQKIPVFSVILSDKFLHIKASLGNYEVFEKENKNKYEEFKELVKTKIIKEVDDCKDLKMATINSITWISNQNNLNGWVRASEVEMPAKLMEENEQLKKDIEKYKDKNEEKLEELENKKTGSRVRLIIELFDVSKLSEEIRISIKKDILEKIQEKKDILKECYFSGSSYAHSDNFIHITFDSYTWISNQSRKYLDEEINKIVEKSLEKYDYSITCEIKDDVLWQCQ